MLAGWPSEQNLPLRGQIRAAQNLHQRGFARGVVAHKTQDLPRIERKVNAAQGMHRAEALVDVAHLNDR